MILTGQSIVQNVASGAIKIDPFDIKLVNPNSYNYRLGEELLIMPGPIDARQQPVVQSVRIPEDGYVLMPNTIYLGHTYECIGSDDFVPSLIGRSSIGRLGLFLQITADLGHLGTYHKWTLELKVVQPLRVYHKMRIGQVSFWQPEEAKTAEPITYASTPDSYAMYSSSAPSQVKKFFE